MFLKLKISRVSSKTQVGIRIYRVVRCLRLVGFKTIIDVGRLRLVLQVTCSNENSKKFSIKIQRDYTGIHTLHLLPVK